MKLNQFRLFLVLGNMKSRVSLMWNRMMFWIDLHLDQVQMWVNFLFIVFINFICACKIFFYLFFTIVFSIFIFMLIFNSKQWNPITYLLAHTLFAMSYIKCLCHFTLHFILTWVVPFHVISLYFRNLGYVFWRK